MLCERAAEAALPGRVLTVRPGLIVGPHDPTDRFTYWPVRVAEGGAVLAPGEPDMPIQLIDVRDLAAWTLDLIEEGTTGTFNAVSTPGRFTFGGLLATCREVSGSNASFVWVNQDFLSGQDVKPWHELPLWIPGEAKNFSLVSNAKAAAAGLKIRTLAQTVADTLAWHAELPANRAWRAGLAREKERTVLSAWRERTAPHGAHHRASL